MFERKKSFIIYHDSGAIVDMLTDEEAGKLFKALFRFSIDNDSEPLEMDQLTEMAFVSIRNYMIRDAKKYEERCEKNRQIALEREARKRKKSTNVNERTRTTTKSTDSDNDSDSDNDNDSDTETDTDTEASDADSVSDRYTLEEIKKCAADNNVKLSDKGIRAFYDQIKAESWTMYGRPIEILARAMNQFAKTHTRDGLIKTDKQPKKNAFHNFDQRDYDYDEIEKRLTQGGARWT